MAYSVTAYNVMIGSPSDVQERRLVECILAKWNHKHGEEKKLVFYPSSGKMILIQIQQDVHRRRY